MVLPLSEHELWFTMTKLDPHSLVIAAAACRHWRGLAEDDALWRWQCADAWTGKSYVPRRFMEAGGMTRKRAYFEALRDSRRTEMTSEELCTFTWERTWTGASQCRSDDDIEVDPRSLRGDICEYTQTHQRRVNLRHSDCEAFGTDSSDDGGSDDGTGGGRSRLRAHRVVGWGRPARASALREDGLSGETVVVYYGRMRVIAAGRAGLGADTMGWCMTTRQSGMDSARVSYIANCHDELSEHEDEEEEDHGSVFGSFYPPKAVRRTAQWGWTMQNAWARYCMVGTTVEFRRQLEDTLTKVPKRE